MQNKIKLETSKKLVLKAISAIWLANQMKWCMFGHTMLDSSFILIIKIFTDAADCCHTRNRWCHTKFTNLQILAVLHHSFFCSFIVKLPEGIIYTSLNMGILTPKFGAVFTVVWFFLRNASKTLWEKPLLNIQYIIWSYKSNSQLFTWHICALHH